MKDFSRGLSWPKTSFFWRVNRQFTHNLTQRLPEEKYRFLWSRDELVIKKTLLMTWCVGFGGRVYNLFPFFCVWKKIAQFFSGSILIIGCPILDIELFFACQWEISFWSIFWNAPIFSFLKKWQNALQIIEVFGSFKLF